jgi:esterase/lipase superfamily enzyme
VNREHHRWYSPSLGRDMELLLFGHTGTPVLVFPTSMGRFFEYEDRGMVRALERKIEEGWFRLFCVDSIDAESWYNLHVHPFERVARHLAYERYLLDEVLALARRLQTASEHRIITTGCSLGAFHATLLALRHPSKVVKLVSLSGKYENSSFLDGHSNLDSYLTNPLAFVPGLAEGQDLQAIRAIELNLVTGSTDPHVIEARELSRVLWDKCVPNVLDIWDGWVHDWPYWQQMIVKYL